MNIRTIDDFEGLMDFLFDTMDTSFKALRVITNFIDKENAKTIEAHIQSLEESLVIGKKKILELKNNFKIIHLKDFDFFIPYLKEKIKEKNEYIKDCNERVFMPYEDQKAWKEQLKKELKPLLDLAEKYNININEDSEKKIETDKIQDSNNLNRRVCLITGCIHNELKICKNQQKDSFDFCSGIYPCNLLEFRIDWKDLFFKKEVLIPLISKLWTELVITEKYNFWNNVINSEALEFKNDLLDIIENHLKQNKI